MKLPVYNIKGEKVKELELDSGLFDVEIKPEVVHQVVVAQMANKRQVIANTKDKSEVRGGGRKPWRQKGTGRARHGSNRSPLWKGGGVTFGPTNERNFKKSVNKKQKRLALAMCLSDKAKEGTLVILDKLELENAKTNEIKKIIADLKGKIENIKESKRVLLVSDKNDRGLIRATLNLDNVNVTMANSLNCVELLKYNSVVLPEAAIELIQKHYSRVNNGVAVSEIKEVKEVKEVKDVKVKETIKE
jgi:large subunit ribosomal protein L4